MKTDVSGSIETDVETDQRIPTLLGDWNRHIEVLVNEVLDGGFVMSFL